MRVLGFREGSELLHKTTIGPKLGPCTISYFIPNFFPYTNSSQESRCEKRSRGLRRMHPFALTLHLDTHIVGLFLFSTRNLQLACVTSNNGPRPLIYAHISEFACLPTVRVSPYFYKIVKIVWPCQKRVEEGRKEICLCAQIDDMAWAPQISPHFTGLLMAMPRVTMMHVVV